MRGRVVIELARLGRREADGDNHDAAGRGELPARQDRDGCPGTPPGGLDRTFEPADRLFAEMNDDCVKSAKAALR